MKNIIDVFKSFEDFVSINGASDEEIEKAQQALSVIFAEDYREYLRTFGAASANGHEFTGIIKSKRLNVVEATKNAKTKIPGVSKELYLIEDTGIDQILTWQDTAGKLYQTIGAGNPEMLKKSFADYVMGN
jgi:hypothetical protein